MVSIVVSVKGAGDVTKCGLRLETFLDSSYTCALLLPQVFLSPLYTQWVLSFAKTNLSPAEKKPTGELSVTSS